LQILFNVLNDKNQEVAATGFLTETGGITFKKLKQVSS
jgi:hypothetical protein